MDDIEVKLTELESKDQKPVYCIKCSKELKTIEYFKKNKIENVYPCHCVKDCVMEVFSEHFPNKPISVGSKLNF